MPGPRVQTGGIRQPGVRPVASPVDTFTAPRGGTELARLAEGLSVLAPQLTRYSDVMAARDAEEQKAQGQALAQQLAEEGKSYQAAIKEGLIRPDQSPWFRLGASETMGRAAAERFRGDLAVAVGESGLAEETDPAKYDQFVAEFTQKWRGEHIGGESNTAFENSFGNLANNYLAQMRANFSAQAGARLAKRATEDLGARAFSLALDGHTGDMDAETVARLVSLDMDRAIAAGTNPRAVNTAIIAAVTDAARRTKDSTLLDILDHLHTGPGGVLGETQEARQAVTETQERVAQLKRSDHAEALQLEREQREKALRDVNTEVTRTLLANPHADLSTYQKRLLDLGEADAARNLFTIQQQVENGSDPFDEEQMDSLTMDIYEGKVGLNSLLAMRANGSLNRQEFDYALRAYDDKVQKQEHAADRAYALAHRREGTSLFEDPAFKLGVWQDAERDLSRLWGDALVPGQAVTARRNGLYHARQMWWEYVHNEGGSQAGTQAQMQKALEISELIRQRYGVEDKSGGDGGNSAPGNPMLPYTRYRLVGDATLDDLARGKRPGSGLYSIMVQSGVNPADPKQVRAFVEAQRKIHE